MPFSAATLDGDPGLTSSALALLAVPSLAPGKIVNKALLKKAVREADVIVAGYHQLERYGPEELDGKVVITATISPERQEFLKERGVRVVIDCSIQLFEQTVAPSSWTSPSPSLRETTSTGRSVRSSSHRSRRRWRGCP